MTVSSVMNSKSMAKVVGVCVLGLGMVLGGCNNKIKDENAALMSQNQALIAENNQIRENQAQLSAQVAAMQQQAAAQPPAPMAEPSGGYSGPRGGGNSRGGGSEVFVMAGDVLFDSGSATLKSTAKKDLDSVVSKIKSRHSGASVRVEGHTDSDPIRKSKWGSNEALSKARANAVRDYLVQKGIGRDLVSTVGKGASEPKGSKKESRRVEIVVAE